MRRVGRQWTRNDAGPGGASRDQEDPAPRAADEPEVGGAEPALQRVAAPHRGRARGQFSHVFCHVGSVYFYSKTMKRWVVPPKFLFSEAKD